MNLDSVGLGRTGEFCSGGRVGGRGTTRHGLASFGHRRFHVIEHRDKRSPVAAHRVHHLCGLGVVDQPAASPHPVGDGGAKESLLEQGGLGVGADQDGLG